MIYLVLQESAINDEMVILNTSKKNVKDRQESIDKSKIGK
jgi:hypothetical protein